jgi:osmotically inducible protein OsmC
MDLALLARHAGGDSNPSDVAIDAKVTLLSGDRGAFELGVELDVELPSIADPALAAELMRATHELCPYSKATRGNIDLALTANGVAVTEAEAVVG